MCAKLLTSSSTCSNSLLLELFLIHQRQYDANFLNRYLQLAQVSRLAHSESYTVDLLQDILDKVLEIDIYIWVFLKLRSYETFGIFILLPIYFLVVFHLILPFRHASGYSFAENNFVPFSVLVMDIDVTKLVYMCH